MPRITFCPHHILDIDVDLDPRVIEAFYISPLVDFIKAANSSDLKVCISHNLLVMFEDKHPWSLSNDSKWSKWIADWYGVLKPLFDDMEIITHQDTKDERSIRCTGISEEVNNIFSNFLNTIASHGLYDGLNEESVFTPTPWCSNFHDFITIKTPEQINFAQYTWYKIYPHSLPCTGNFPFVPPDDWRRNKNPRKAGAPSYGYIDKMRREWCWDKLHDNHWDVQNQGGGRGNYCNVTPNGEIL